MFIIVDSNTDVVIDKAETIEAAKESLDFCNDMAKDAGFYEEGLYEIREVA